MIRKLLIAQYRAACLTAASIWNRTIALRIEIRLSGDVSHAF